MFETPIGSSIYPVKPIGKGCEFISGYAFKSKDFVESGYPVIKIKNIQNGKVTTRDSQFVADETITKNLSKFRLDNGDVLIAMTGQGSVGRVGKLYVFSNETPYLNQRVGKFVADEKTLNKDYLYYVISTKGYENYLFSAGSGSGQPNLSPSIIKSVEIPYPPYDVQCRLGQILKAIDDKIELNRQTNKTLEQIAQAIFKSWFVDFDPVKAKILAKQEWATSMTGKTVENNEKAESIFIERAAMCAISGKTLAELDQLSPETQQQLKAIASLFPGALVESELGEIPERWEVRCISDLGKVITGKTPPKMVENAYSGEGVPFITPTDIDESVFVSSTNRFLTSEGQASIKKSMIKGGSICVTCIGSQMGKTVVSPQGAFTNQQINSIAISESYYRNYLLLNLRNRREEIYLIGSSGSTMPIINKSMFEKLNLVTPSVSLLKQFDSYVESLIHKILEGALENIDLGEVRDLLLPKLLSGELDVSELVGNE